MFKHLQASPLFDHRQQGRQKVLGVWVSKIARGNEISYDAPLMGLFPWNQLNVRESSSTRKQTAWTVQTRRQIAQEA